MTWWLAERLAALVSRLPATPWFWVPAWVALMMPALTAFAYYVPNLHTEDGSGNGYHDFHSALKIAALFVVVPAALAVLAQHWRKR